MWLEDLDRAIDAGHDGGMWKKRMENCLGSLAAKTARGHASQKGVAFSASLPSEEPSASSSSAAAAWLGFQERVNESAVIDKQDADFPRQEPVEKRPWRFLR